VISNPSMVTVTPSTGGEEAAPAVEETVIRRSPY
jgi:hypothetical protein